MAGVHEILGANGDVAKHDGFYLPGSGPACIPGDPGVVRRVLGVAVPEVVLHRS